MTSFAPIPGLPAGYTADSDGNIYGPRGPRRLAVQRAGHLTFPVYRPELHAPRNASVHRCVYAAFHGPIPEGLVIRHLDGNPGNNNLSNLASGTNLDNRRDSVRHGTNARGERVWTAKLTEDDVRRIRTLADEGNRYSDIAKLFPVNDVMVSRIARRAAWRHVQ